MLKTLEDALNATCLIGLSYFDVDGNLTKQNLLAGTVKSVDKENGITLALKEKSDGKSADFILPANLSCWFKAPPGSYHTSQADVKIENPDYLVTWDIYQTQEKTEDGEQQWWEWVARTETPSVGDQKNKH